MVIDEGAHHTGGQDVFLFLFLSFCVCFVSRLAIRWRPRLVH